MASVLPDKWQVVRNSAGGKPVKKQANGGGDKALFKPVPLAANTYENLENEEQSSDDDFRYELNGKMNGKKPTVAVMKNGKKPGKGAVAPPVAPDVITLEFSKLAGSIGMCRSKFPDNDLLILQEVANFLRMDADFSGAIKLSPSIEEFSFPLKHLNPRQLAELRGVVGSVNDEEAYCKFIEYAIDELVTAYTRNDSLLSHRLCLQLISLERPEAFLQLAEKYAGVIKNSKTSQNKLNAIMSAFSQAGLGSLSVGLNVWITVMLPTIQLPNMTSVTLAYCEKLLNAYNVLNDLQLPPSSAPQALRPAFDLLMTSLQNCQPYNPPPNFELFAREVAVSPQNFFRLNDLVYPVNAATGKMSQPASLSRMTPAQKRQLATICYKIKVLLMKFGTDCSPASMFPSFLVRYNENLPVFVKKEMLSNLLVCLHCDQNGCSTAWLGSCDRYRQNAGYLSSSVNENMSFFAYYIPDLAQFRRTLKKVDAAVANAGKGDGQSRRGICGRFFSGVFYILRTIIFISILALGTDLLLNNCDPNAMYSTKFLHQHDLYRPLAKTVHNIQKRSMDGINYLYPYVGRLYTKLIPFSVKVSETVWAIYEPTAKYAAIYWKEAQKHGGKFYVYALDYSQKANVWLVSNGVDVKAFGTWMTTTAIPTATKQVYDGSVAFSNYLNENVIPWLRQLVNSGTATATSNNGL